MIAISESEDKMKQEEEFKTDRPAITPKNQDENNINMDQNEIS